MKPRALLVEIVKSAWAGRVQSVLVTVMVAAMCFSALATVGRSAATAADVADRMEQAGARRLVVVDGRNRGFINDRTLAAVRGLSTVEGADALGMPFDTVNGVLGRGASRVPLWPVIGDPSRVGELVWGRAPGPGEALISVTKLAEAGLDRPAGYLEAPDTGEEYPIVGAFKAREPFADLAAGGMVVAQPGATAREIRVVISSVDDAESTVPAVMSILAPKAAEGVLVETPSALAQTARDINEQLAGAGRSLLLVILAAGGVFVGSVALANVLVKRRDLGRRRTLGITRADLVRLVTGRVLLNAAMGAVVGCLSGWVVNRSLGITTPWEFTAGVGVLAMIAAGVASLPPAVYAARLDPVAVLRTP